MRFVITFLILSVFFGNKLYAQSEIKVYDKKINRLDKKNRKQGEWLFFNPEGFAIFSCTYKNDNRISPIVFYENSDTAFVKFEKKIASRISSLIIVRKNITALMFIPATAVTG